MKEKIRVGIIGCGNIATWHIKGIMNSPDLEVGALCDILPNMMDEKAALSGISKNLCYGNHIEMMDSGNIDAVSICTPNFHHYRSVMDAIERGLPYAVEKPLCSTQAEAELLFDETEKKGLPNMVCFSYRFKAAARYARDMIQSGQLGTIYHINGEYFQEWGLPDAADGKPVALRWRFSKEQSVTGVLGDLGSHMIDLCRFMTGREFTRVAADLDTFIHERPTSDGGVGVVDVDDYINMIGQMDGHVAANLSITRYAYGRGNYQRVEVYGEKGAVRYTLEETDRLEVNMGNSPMRAAHIWCEVPVPQRYSSDQMQSFADIVNGCGDGLAANIRDGWKSQQVIDNALAAAESGVCKSL